MNNIYDEIVSAISEVHTGGQTEAYHIAAIAVDLVLDRLVSDVRVMLDARDAYANTANDYWNYPNSGVRSEVRIKAALKAAAQTIRGEDG